MSIEKVFGLFSRLNRKFVIATVAITAGGFSVAAISARHLRHQADGSPTDS